MVKRAVKYVCRYTLYYLARLGLSKYVPDWCMAWLIGGFVGSRPRRIK